MLALLPLSNQTAQCKHTGYYVDMRRWFVYCGFSRQRRPRSRLRMRRRRDCDRCSVRCVFRRHLRSPCAHTTSPFVCPATKEIIIKSREMCKQSTYVSRLNIRVQCSDATFQRRLGAQEDRGKSEQRDDNAFHLYS